MYIYIEYDINGLDSSVEPTTEDTMVKVKYWSSVIDLMEALKELPPKACLRQIKSIP